MDEVCPQSTFFDFCPRRGDWNAVTREQLAAKGNELSCLKGLQYDRNAFRIKDGDKRFLIDYLPFKTFYEPYTRDSIRIIASSGVTLRIFLELLKVVEICGHTILAVSGFDDTSGDIRVPGTYRHCVTYGRIVHLPRRIKDDYIDIDCDCEDDGPL
jgi:hypothetical protein